MLAKTIVIISIIM